MSKALVKEKFGAAAQSYAVSKVHAQGASLGRLLELVQPQANWQVLDVATGAGHTALTFAPHVAQVIASDITPEMLATTARLAENKGVSSLTVQEADAEHLPFDDAKFDLVTCRIAPHHFEDIPAFLRETARVLKPNGLLALVDNTVPAGPAGEYINAIEKLRDPSHVCCLSLEEWQTAISEAGFTLLVAESAPKGIEFVEWATRMTDDETILATLRQRLLNAPPAVHDFLQPQPFGDGDIAFTLAEALLIGRKAS
jgi:ubiquinone/menaquinone biosynthesis C-methylase UbiE